jgi:uncharacterized protein (TIGR03435 family)
MPMESCKWRQRERAKVVWFFDRCVVMVLFVVPSVLGQGSVAHASAAPQLVAGDIKVPDYDVVSIKPDKSAAGGMVRIMNKPDGFSATNVTMKMLLQNSYGIREDLISSGAGWVDSQHFDVDAKVAGQDVDVFKKLNNEERRLMLQKALADRFSVKVHSEMKQLPVFDLVVVNSAKLTKANVGDTYSNGIKGFDGVAHAGMMSMEPGKLTGQGIPISTLVNVLAQRLRRTVIDKTGLKDTYDLTMTWAPDEESGGDQQPDSSGPSIFTALQEQLGLKLQSDKGPVKTLVIDHVEMPSEN